MIKKIINIVLSAMLMFTVCGLPCMAAPSSNSYSEAVAIWPMDDSIGYWYTDQYSYDGYSVKNRLDTDSIKLLSSEIKNNVWRASLSPFAPGKTADAAFNFTNGGEIIDLNKDNYLYYDFTMQDVMWKLTIRIGVDGQYAWDVDIPLQKLICEEEGTAYLIDNSQYGVRGVYQGRIDLNEAIRESGNNEIYGIDYTNQKIHLISGSLSYFMCYSQDVMEIRYIGIGHGNKAYNTPTEQLTRIESSYEAKDVSVTGEFVEGDELVNLIDPSFDWLTNISMTEQGAVGAQTGYLSLDTSEGAFAIQATGQSVTDKAYIRGAVVGWPQLTCTPVGGDTIFADNIYLVYDFVAETGWDVLLTFNDWYKISLADVMKGITAENTLEGLTTVNGTRGYGSPGTYSGVLNLEEVLNYYIGNLGVKVCINRQARLSGITFIYENSEDNDTSLKNTYNMLKIVKKAPAETLDAIGDSETLTTGVYKPAGYETPVYPEAEPMQNSANLENGQETENATAVSSVAIAVLVAGVIILILILTVAVILIRKYRKHRTIERSEDDE